ncbi:hypothetical protein HOK51_10530 [Candidatus Woesearchaeota archaeon]|jgi:hypothetical protein|nr:hypothetical protein [Candidatus Woesearchaeota archaeon]MBT7368026.1 hypothetical protein [Candidatus Woesearchaeota archaeon]
MEFKKYSEIYFKTTYKEWDSENIKIEITESATHDHKNEEFHLRIKTTKGNYNIELDDDENYIIRNYGIEKHEAEPHNHPHLQFKFSTEKIGKIRIRIDLKNNTEYDKAITGFIYNMKFVLDNIEQSLNISSEIMNNTLVTELKENGLFLLQKLEKGIIKYSTELENDADVSEIEKDELINLFLGKRNTKLLIEQQVKETK